MLFNEWTLTKVHTNHLEETVKQGLDDYKSADAPRAAGWVYDDGAWIETFQDEAKMLKFHVHVGIEEFTTTKLDDAEAFLWYEHSRFNYDDADHSIDTSRVEPHTTF